MLIIGLVIVDNSVLIYSSKIEQNNIESSVSSKPSYRLLLVQRTFIDIHVFSVRDTIFFTGVSIDEEDRFGETIYRTIVSIHFIDGSLYRELSFKGIAIPINYGRFKRYVVLVKNFLVIATTESISLVDVIRLINRSSESIISKEVFKGEYFIEVCGLIYRESNETLDVLLKRYSVFENKVSYALASIDLANHTITLYTNLNSLHIDLLYYNIVDGFTNGYYTSQIIDKPISILFKESSLEIIVGNYYNDSNLTLTFKNCELLSFFNYNEYLFILLYDTSDRDIVITRVSLKSIEYRLTRMHLPILPSDFISYNIVGENLLAITIAYSNVFEDIERINLMQSFATYYVNLDTMELVSYDTIPLRHSFDFCKYYAVKYSEIEYSVYKSYWFFKKRWYCNNTYILPVKDLDYDSIPDKILFIPVDDHGVRVLLYSSSKKGYIPLAYFDENSRMYLERRLFIDDIVVYDNSLIVPYFEENKLHLEVISISLDRQYLLNRFLEAYIRLPINHTIIYGSEHINLYVEVKSSSDILYAKLQIVNPYSRNIVGEYYIVSAVIGGNDTGAYLIKYDIDPRNFFRYNGVYLIVLELINREGLYVKKSIEVAYHSLITSSAYIFVIEPLEKTLYIKSNKIHLRFYVAHHPRDEVNTTLSLIGSGGRIIEKYVLGNGGYYDVIISLDELGDIFGDNIYVSEVQVKAVYNGYSVSKSIVIVKDEFPPHVDARISYSQEGYIVVGLDLFDESPLFIDLAIRSSNGIVVARSFSKNIRPPTTYVFKLNPFYFREGNYMLLISIRDRVGRVTALLEPVMIDHGRLNSSFYILDLGEGEYVVYRGDYIKIPLLIQNIEKLYITIYPSKGNASTTPLFIRRDVISIEAGQDAVYATYYNIQANLSSYTIVFTAYGVNNIVYTVSIEIVFFGSFPQVKIIGEERLFHKFEEANVYVLSSSYTMVNDDILIKYLPLEIHCEKNCSVELYRLNYLGYIELNETLRYSNYLDYIHSIEVKMLNIMGSPGLGNTTTLAKYECISVNGSCTTVLANISLKIPTHLLKVQDEKQRFIAWTILLMNIRIVYSGYVFGIVKYMPIIIDINKPFIEWIKKPYYTRDNVVAYVFRVFDETYPVRVVATNYNRGYRKTIYVYNMAETIFELDLVEGLNVFNISFIDLAGNKYTEQLTIYRDTRPPRLSVNYRIKDGIVLLNISASDEGVGLGFIKIFIDDNETGVYTQENIYLEKQLSKGIHNITIYAYDKLGNYVFKTITINIEPFHTLPKPPSIPSYIPSTWILLSIALLLLITTLLYYNKRRYRKHKKT